MAAPFPHSNLLHFKSYLRIRFSLPYQPQYFSLPSGIIHYINSNPRSAGELLKIQKTCKYFYVKNQIVIVREDVYQGKNGLYRNYDKWPLQPLKKYWFINSLVIDNSVSFNLFKTLYRCNLKKLELFFYNMVDIFLSELNFCLNDGKLESFSLVNVNIRNENGAIVYADQLLAKLPNITDFNYNLNSQIFTNQTFTNMNCLKFNSKFKQFHFTICFLQEDIDFSLLCDFIKKNSTFNSEIFVIFDCDNSQQFLEAFQTIAKNQINYTTCKNNVSIQIFGNVVAITFPTSLEVK